MSRTDISFGQTYDAPYDIYVSGSFLGTSSGSSSYRREVRSGITTPKFGAIRTLTDSSRFLLPINPFLYEKDYVLRFAGTYSETYTPTGYSTSYVGNVYPIIAADVALPWEPTPEEINSLRAQAGQKVLEYAKDQKVNIAQVWAERKRTADMIASTATALTDAVRKLWKKDFVGAANALGVKVSKRKRRAFNRQWRRNQSKAVANGWLQLQYGWKPLLADIYGSAEWLASKQYREIQTRVKFKAKLANKSDELRELTKYTAYVRNDAKFDLTCTVWFATSGAELASLAQSGISNPTLLAWELLPYSFVADWFIPIGNYLQSLDATIGLTFRQGCYSQYLNSKVTVRCQSKGKMDGLWRYDADFRNSASKIRFQRVLLAYWPEARLPNFKNPFSFVHAANAIALLVQAFNPSTKTRYR